MGSCLINGPRVDFKGGFFWANLALKVLERTDFSVDSVSKQNAHMLDLRQLNGIIDKLSCLLLGGNNTSLSLEFCVVSTVSRNLVLVMLSTCNFISE